MSAPFHRRSEKKGVRPESAGDTRRFPGGRSSHSSLLFTHSLSALYLVAALTVALAVACGAEPAPRSGPAPNSHRRPPRGADSNSRRSFG